MKTRFQKSEVISKKMHSIGYPIPYPYTLPYIDTQHLRESNDVRLQEVRGYTLGSILRGEGGTYAGNRDLLCAIRYSPSVFAHMHESYWGVGFVFYACKRVYVPAPILTR